MSRLRGAPKAPLAIAGILATPLFFAGLMAFALKLDKPSVHIGKRGAHVLGEPTKATVGTIYLLAIAVSAAVVLVGLLAMLLRSRLAVVVPAFAAIVATALLTGASFSVPLRFFRIHSSVSAVLPFSTWRDEHTARYPDGVDLIPRSNPGDLILRGEWEHNAYTTARQLGFWTIVMSVVAIALAAVFEVRRRRGIVGPAVPLPPEVVAGEPQVVRQTPRTS